MTAILSAIHIYPVKALGGISLSQSAITTRGFPAAIAALGWIDDVIDND